MRDLEGRNHWWHLSGRCILVLLACAALVPSGCTTIRKDDALEVGVAGNTYLTNRVRDSMDMVTLTGSGGLGVTGRVGPIHAGTYLGFDIVGLRAGALVPIERTGVPEGAMFAWFTGDPVLEGIIQDEYEDATPYWHVESEVPFFAWPGLTPHHRSENTTAGSRHYLTQIDLALGLVPAVRVGVNPGEMVDFVVGWTTLDIMADDTAAMEESEGKNQSADP